MRKAFLWAALMVTPALAPAAVIGNMFGSFINGTVRPGDAKWLDRHFSDAIAKGVTIKIAPDSDAFETMRIGLWLKERRPALELKASCIGPCASFVLTSGSKVRVDPGVLIALNVRPEWEAWAFGRVREGDLFIDQEMSQLSRARLLERFKLKAQSSGLMRDAADQLMPASATKFLRDLTLPDSLDHVSFDEHSYDFKLQMRVGRCFWWVPDAQGLKQLGVEATGYQPVDRAQAAKQLGIDQRLIYAGPAVDPIPESGLCPLS